MNVYVISSAGGMCKVGITSNDPKTRLTGLATGHPYALEVAACFNVPTHLAQDIERRAHSILSSKRMAGEWFAVSVTAAADAIRKAIGPRGLGVEAGCGNCAHSRMRGERRLECRISPPLSDGAWPAVDATDWCSQHKPETPPAHELDDDI